MKWHGAGSSLRLHGLVLAEPLAYVSVDRRASGAPIDPSEIVRGLVVDPRSGPGSAPAVGGYARLTPGQRWAYLEWLASGRGALPPDPGLATLHLMGLERRALADGADLPGVVREVCRVRDLAARAVAAVGPGGASAGARRWSGYLRQSGALLWILLARHPEAFSERDVRVLSSRAGAWGEDALSSVLGWCVGGQGGGSLPSWLGLVVAEHLPGARRSVVRRRLADRFEALFTSRFAERWPGGMPLRSARGGRAIGYRPSNGTLDPVEVRAPDVLGIATQFSPLVEMWNGCLDDLRSLSRVADDGAAPTLAQWEAMPPDLREGIDHPLSGPIAALGDGGRGHAIVGAGELAALVGIERRERITIAQSRRVADVVGAAGSTLEPDARLTGTAYRWDEPVVVMPGVLAAHGDGTGYLAASCVLRLGAAVALADGAAEDQELRPIAEELERAFDLGEDDHRRLEALLTLLRERGSEVRAVGKRLVSTLSDEARASVGRLLIAVAAADGVVREEERATLRSCFRALGLPASEIESSLAVISGEPGSAEPAETGEALSLRLDRGAIDRIMAETREVAVLLARAMSGEATDSGPEHPAGPEPSADAAPDPQVLSPEPRPAEPAQGSEPLLPGLHPRFVPFWRAIVARDRWSRDEAEAEARRHGLMLDGALDAINDAAFDAADGPVLVDDGGVIVVDCERRARMLRNAE